MKSPQVKLISWATAIRWVGWGMMEPIAAIFLFSLVKSYGLAGFIDSLAGITFVLLVPFAGQLADRVSLKTFLIIGLFFFFPGSLWSLSAVTGFVIFAVIGNILCGIALASDVVGRATYIRRFIPENRIATVMGSQNTLLFLGTIIGCCITWLIVPFVSFAWIFFWIIPTNLATLILFALYLKSDKVPKKNVKVSEEYSFKNYLQIWKDGANLKNGLGFLAFLMMFLYAILAFCEILIPIYAFTHGASYQQVILLYILAILPQLFSSPLGKIADKWRGSILCVGFILISVFIGLFALLTSYIFMLTAIFILQIFVVLLCLVIENLITSKTESTHYGRVSAVFEGLKEAGKYVGAIGLGLFIDWLGPNTIFVSLASITLIIAGLTLRKFNFNII